MPYPVFINMTNMDVLVVGAGEVGLRKIASLAECFPRNILVIDPFLADETEEMFASQYTVTCKKRAFSPDDLQGKTLVFAATSNREVNALVGNLCAEKGILCNIADDQDASSFFVPAHFTQGGITVALSTGGQSPALARHLRKELEAWMGKRYSGLLLVLGRLRPMILELGLPTKENTALFRDLVHSQLAEHLEKKDILAAKTLLSHHLPEQLHSRMGELLYEL